MYIPFVVGSIFYSLLTKSNLLIRFFSCPVSTESESTSATLYSIVLVSLEFDLKIIVFHNYNLIDLIFVFIFLALISAVTTAISPGA